MTDEQRYRIGSRVVREGFDDEEIIINLDSGSYFSLDAVGARILADLAAGRSLRATVRSVESSYRADPGEVAGGVRALVDQLTEHGLLVAVEPGREVEPLGPAEDGGAPAEDRPRFTVPRLEIYTDMQDLLLLDPIHDVDETGWPQPRPEGVEGET